MKKVFEITINYTESTWGSAYAMVEAETEEEARELFEDNPHDYDWDGWDTFDSEVRHWEIDTVECDEFMTKRLHEKQVKPLLEKITERMKADDLNDQKGLSYVNSCSK